MNSLTKHLGRIVPRTSALFLCDMQEKFRPMIQYFTEIVSNSNRLLHAANIMEIPVFVTEQFPKGLGNTVPELEIAKFSLTPYEKTNFSMINDKSSLLEDMKKIQPETKSIILCGIETQACIHHTTLNLIDIGYDVHVVADCCSSRSMTDRLVALKRIRDMGAHITTCEAVILGLTADSAHPKFKPLQKLIMTPSAETGLVKNSVDF